VQSFTVFLGESANGSYGNYSLGSASLGRRR
jgi:hypothetical protein